MRVYTKIVIDIDTMDTVEEEFFEYHGPVAECKGGGGGSGVDHAYNAGMLALSQEQQDWASQLYNQFVYGVTYDPNERGAMVDGKWVSEADLGEDYSGSLATRGSVEGYDDTAQTSELEYLQNVVEANQDLLGLQTETDTAQLGLTQEQIAAQSAVLPGQTEATIAGLNLATTQSRAAEGLVPFQTEAERSGLVLSTEQSQAGRELLPFQTEAQKSGLTLETAQNRSRESLVPRTTELAGAFLDDSMKGLDVGEQKDLAQAEVQHGFKNARRTMAKNVSSYGQDPNSGMYASQNRDMALAEATGVAGARTKAGQDTESINFERKRQGLQTVAGL